jgi:hypothetical protein
MRALGKEYRTAKFANNSEALSKIRDFAGKGGGSPTAEKLKVMGALGLGGGVFGAGQGDFEEDPLGTLGKVAAGSIGGLALSKGFPKLQQLAMAKASPTLQKLKGVADDLAAKGPSINTDALADLIGRAEKVAPRLPGAMVKAGEEVQPLQAEAEQAQAEGNAPKAELMANLNNRLEMLYQQNYSDMPRDEFDSKIAELTDNFSNKQSLGRILFDNKEDLEKYNRQLQAAEALEGINTDEVLKAAPMIVGRDREGQLQEQKFLDALALARSGFDASKITAADQKAVKQDLEKVRKFPELLPDLMQSYGLDISDLQALGVV